MESSAGCKRFLFNLNNGLVRMNYHFADVVTSLCDFNRRWQLRFGVDPSKIAIVPNGIDADRFYPSSSSERSRPVILTMARIYPLKGIIHLVNAARFVLDRVPDARFRILGDVGNTAYFKECQQVVSTYGLSNAIEFGRTDDSPRAYREASVFCLPSISEAMPYSVLEAMFSGCPVVATDVGGVSEMIDGVGLLVKPGDEKALAEALISLLDAEDGASRRRNLAALALARARSLYSQRQCVGKFEEIYRELSIGSVTTEVSASTFRSELVSTP
jgi:glycosyltransferase involved in cell wall biosynthesis